MTRGSDQIITATVFKSIRDLNEDTLRLQVDTLVASRDRLERVSMPAVDSVKPAAIEISPSGKYSLIIRNGKEDKPIVELNSIDGVCFKVDASEYHGKVVGDSFLGLISFSKDEKFAAYVANAKPKFKKLNSLLDITDDIASRGSKFEPVEDYGEKYDGISTTVVCILNTQTGKIVVLPSIPDVDASAGQPVIRNEGGESYSVIFTSWRSKPKRLGMIYCYQRPCELYRADITQLLAAPSSCDSPPPVKFESITKSLALARSPRLSPSGNDLLFIGRRDRLSSHNGCFSLFKANLASGELTAITPIVSTPGTGADGLMDFPGVYTDQLPKQCFLDESRVVFSSMWGSIETAIVVDTATGSIERLNGRLATILSSEGKNGDELCRADRCSCAVLDVSAGKILFSCSSPSAAPRVGLFGSIDGSLIAGPLNKLSTIALSTFAESVDGTPEVSEELAGLKWQVLTHDSGGSTFESILVLPRRPADEQGSMPLIVVPHGGPHSCMSTSYVASYAYLACECKAAILHVNFRGSTGFGQASIDSLLGNIGSNDVADVVKAIEDTLEMSPLGLIDRNRLAVVGGSHGGFLAAHLVGQYPNLFRACAMRNPVTNIPSMFGVTDIPDWCVVEAEGEGAYDFDSYTGLLSDETVVKMKQRSPVTYIDRVVTPVLMAVGAKDRRVPASQGVDYYHMLRARGVQTKLLVFPEDTHAIDRPASEAEHFVAIAMWFNVHLAAGGMTVSD